MHPPPYDMTKSKYGIFWMNLEKNKNKLSQKVFSHQSILISISIWIKCKNYNINGKDNRIPSDINCMNMGFLRKLFSWAALSDFLIKMSLGIDCNDMV